MRKARLSVLAAIILVAALFAVPPLARATGSAPTLDQSTDQVCQSANSNCGSQINCPAGNLSTSMTFSTSSPGDVIVFYAHFIGTQSSSSDLCPYYSSGPACGTNGGVTLTWHLRLNSGFIASPDSLVGARGYAYEWWAAPGVNYPSNTCTVANNGQATGAVDLLEYSVKGANRSNPFDTNAVFPKWNVSSGNSNGVTGLSTSETNDFLVSYLDTDVSGPALGWTCPPGFTTLSHTSSCGGSNIFLLASYEAVTSLQSGISEIYTLNGGGPNDYLVLADAIRAAPSISSITPTSGPGLTVVNVTGANLVGTTQVEFANIVCLFTAKSDSALWLTIPGSAAVGTFDVIVFVGTSGSSASTADQFTVTGSNNPPPTTPPAQQQNNFAFNTTVVGGTLTVPYQLTTTQALILLVAFPPAVILFSEPARLRAGLAKLLRRQRANRRTSLV